MNSKAPGIHASSDNFADIGWCFPGQFRKRTVETPAMIAQSVLRLTQDRGVEPGKGGYGTFVVCGYPSGQDIGGGDCSAHLLDQAIRLRKEL